jgi:hypothetical protein
MWKESAIGTADAVAIVVLTGEPHEQRENRSRGDIEENRARKVTPARVVPCHKAA